jgi:hypothetical protein
MFQPTHPLGLFSPHCPFSRRYLSPRVPVCDSLSHRFSVKLGSAVLRDVLLASSSLDAPSSLQSLCANIRFSAKLPITAGGTPHAIVTWVDSEFLPRPHASSPLPPQLASADASRSPSSLSPFAWQTAWLLPSDESRVIVAGEEWQFQYEFDAVTGASAGCVDAAGFFRRWGSLAAGADADADGHAAPSPPILGYHFSMVNDVARASAFKGGLADVIQPSSIVVDLGSGSGLLSVMAAKLGARHVFAIEQDSSLAEASRRVMIENGVSHVVSVINRLQ